LYASSGCAKVALRFSRPPSSRAARSSPLLRRPSP
jgi:hypothetical protein